MDEIIRRLMENRNHHDTRLDEMASIGYLAELKYEVYVRTNDPDNIPHFHI